MQIPLLGKTIKPITGRSLKFVDEDKSNWSWTVLGRCRQHPMAHGMFGIMR